LKQKILFLQFAVIPLSLLLIWRLFALQCGDYLVWKNLAEKQHETKSMLSGMRGAVEDIKGRPLVLSLQAFAVGVRPRLIQSTQRSALVNKLSTALSMKESEVQERLNSSKKFIWLKRGVSRENLELLPAIPALEGVPQIKRSYPLGALASVVTGVINREGTGISGVELAFNKLLQGRDLEESHRRDARGDELFENVVMNDVGRNVQLSIDSFIQTILSEEFEVALQDSKAKRVFGAIMDADSGEILALSQSPQFDPENKYTTEDLKNVVLQDTFEPGSTLKPIIAAIALKEKVTSINEIIECSPLTIGSNTITDSHAISDVSLREVLVRSSNTGIARVGLRLGGEKLKAELERFGFGAPSGIELKGEGRGILKQNWSKLDTATSSFGQGISVTALQMMRAFAVLANGGKLVRPMILKTNANNQNSEQLISPAVAATISEALLGVTEEEGGTGLRASIKGIPVSGKTGTAQKVLENGRGYDSENVLASFIGYIDSSKINLNRKLVMFVGVDEPGVKPRWGGVVAAPVFRKVMERVVSYLLTQPNEPLNTRAN
jgi:cell division protein FtsI/penicillin-binding protein 2